jgi:hypothetical protein
MKVIMTNYPKYLSAEMLKDRWLSYNHNVEFGFEVADIDYTKLDKLVCNVSEAIDFCLDKTINKFRIWRGRRVYVRIDPSDTHEMYFNLAVIILPLLRQLLADHICSTDIDNEDVPEDLRSDEHMFMDEDGGWVPDDKLDDRWKYVLNEEIWAFEQIVAEHHQSQFFKNGFDEVAHKEHNDRILNGLRLFGKYFRCHAD